MPIYFIDIRLHIIMISIEIATHIENHIKNYSSEESNQSNFLIKLLS